MNENCSTQDNTEPCCSKTSSKSETAETVLDAVKKIVEQETGGDPQQNPVEESQSDSAKSADEVESEVEDKSTDQENLYKHFADELKKAQEDVEKYKEAHLRAVADLDNFRKRTQRDKDEIRKFANTGLIEDFLPVLDNLALGLTAAENQPEAKNIAEGFVLVSHQLKDVLKRNGLQEVNPEGERFDPNHHESVAHQTHDSIAEDHIISVVRIGYLLNDRLLRPATVVVSSGPEVTTKGEAEEDLSPKEPSPSQESEDSKEVSESE